MRHRHGLRKLNRTSSHRLAMLRNMTVSLLRHEAIKTTLPKAKELRRVVEPILTLGKTDTLANKRLAFSRLRDREMVLKLFAELGPRYANRNGGYLDQPDTYAHEVVDRYVAHDYHQVTDNVRDNWDFSGAVQDIQLLFQVGLDIAQGTTPAWDAGSEFKAAGDERLK